ncbi:protein sidekick-1-like isoform X3 [Amphibalanus amphitrite]|uniref:protein sidekick-1-like isoform X3 n=1 Tax=Amphibalanus amphitrite TaxID=1232801 RepID=UPI001C908886|nr:protein sidekick-1-like isoform X3 [Amphibalanus amphitrite]
MQIQGKLGCAAGPSTPWHDHTSRGPYFDRTMTNNVSTTIGRTVLLRCRIFQLDGQAVSWIRKQDLHILTLGAYSYTTDDRFKVLHEPGGHDFHLQISGVQTSDDGVYECQINTEPKRFWPVTLHVQAAHAKIIGASDRYVQLNSNIQLRCELRVLADPPVTLGWSKGSAAVDVSSPRAGLSIQTERGGHGTTSFLVIARARQRDSGTYTCQPSEGQSATVRVHVLDDDHPAAMQTAGGGRLRPDLPLATALLMTSLVPLMTSLVILACRRDNR